MADHPRLVLAGSRLQLLEQLREDAEPLVLVIDDLHELESPTALAQLQVLLDRAPDNVSFVLASRLHPTPRPDRE